MISAENWSNVLKFSDRHRDPDSIVLDALKFLVAFNCDAIEEYIIAIQPWENKGTDKFLCI